MKQTMRQGRFYCGAPSHAAFDRYNTIAEAIAGARKKLKAEPNRQEVNIVQVVRVVRRADPPVEVIEIVDESELDDSSLCDV